MTTSSDNLSTPPVPAEGEPAFEAPPTGVKGGGGFIALLALANLATWFAFFTPFIYTLQVKIQDQYPGNGTEQANTLAVVVGIGSFFGLIANPLAGRLSDRTTSRFGMRRPWLVGAFLLGIVGLVLISISQDTVTLTLATLVMGVGYTSTLSVILALIPDHVAPDRRAFASGLIGVTQAISIVAGTAIVGQLAQHSLPAAFIVPGIIGFVLMMIRVVTLKDRVLAKEDRKPFSWLEFVSSFWTNPRKNPNFGWAWVSRFFIFMAFGGIVNYQVFFLTAQMGMKPPVAQLFVPTALGVQTLAVIAASIGAGLLSDKVQRRKVFVCASAVIGAVGLILFATATSIGPQYFAALVIIGLAQGTYYAVDLALVTDVLPDRKLNAAKDLGVLSIATQLPTSLIPVFAPALLVVGFGNVVAGSTTNYTALFVGSAIFALIAGVTILRVRGVR